MQKISIKYLDNMEFEASFEGKNEKIKLGAPIQYGGNGNNVGPKSLILASLGGCTAMDVITLIKKKRIDIETLYIDVEGDLTTETPQVFSEFRVFYHFKTQNIDDEIKQKLFKIAELSQQRYCGVAAMLRKIAPIKYSITVNNEQINS